MTPADYPNARSLWEDSPGVGLSTADEQFPLTEYLGRNPGFSLCAECGGHLIGTVLGGHDGRRGYLYHVAVATVWQGQGVGRRLVEMALESLQAAGITKAHIMVYSHNEKGRRFWERLGWKLRDEIALYSCEL
ncbi:MAG: GNAT family N-acetyltransferase [Spirochaetales bacterium]|nr:MAG: GNAT family N-acetyltransferase [Spirochaetales bacterium]